MIDKKEPVIFTLRKRAAEQIWTMRQQEKDNDVYAQRTGNEYISHFLGLNNLFFYIKKNLSAKLILDIGAGNTQGIYEISKSKLGRDLSFMATTMASNDDDLENFLGRGRTIKTSVETLRGIQQESCGGILALNSVAYSKAPELAITRINEVLTPGGVLKATFLQPILYHLMEDFQPHNNFTRKLEELNYDIAIVSNPEAKIDVVLAIKPGKEIITAEELLEKDGQTWKKQIESLNHTSI